MCFLEFPVTDQTLQTRERKEVQAHLSAKQDLLVAVCMIVHILCICLYF